MVPEHSPSAPALLLPMLQMAGGGGGEGAGAGQSRSGGAQAQASCTRELGACLGGPQESPSPTLHTYSPPSKPSLFPSPAHC